jgi:hypothetical protein
MAASKKANLGATKKLKPSGNVKFIKDYVFDPSSKSDWAWTLAGGRVVGGIGKAGKKFVTKVYRNMGR